MGAVSAAIGAGFADPVSQSQAIFRALLDAMARPGRIVEIGATLTLDRCLSPAAAAAALTLADFETPIWLSARLADATAWLRFHCGCAVVSHPDAARFAFATAQDALPPLERFDLGSDEFPDRSTTLVLEVASLSDGAGLQLSGPGIRDTARLAVGGLPTSLWEERDGLHELFPRGLDLILTCGTRIAALPRTTRVEI
jgi:alpha-D-ribose 1-methylphosphonate 5-triphosphate synthase subunit PhnH